MKIGVLHPGEMGSSLGDALVQAKHQVFWASVSRSELTRARATGWQEKIELKDLVEEVGAIISVCPPSEALAIANAVAAFEFNGIYVDANAISPQSSLEIADLFGERYVDGGIIGPPARQFGSTRLYMSGVKAELASSWFHGGLLEARVLSTDPGVEASALKMAYAGYTKGSSALLILINAFAEHLGVRESLQEEWALSQPGLASSSDKAAGATAAKAWRFVGEMEEIAKTMSASDLPSGFHEAAAELYQMMADLKYESKAELDYVLNRILQNRINS